VVQLAPEHLVRASGQERLVRRDVRPEVAPVGVSNRFVGDFMTELPKEDISEIAIAELDLFLVEFALSDIDSVHENKLHMRFSPHFRLHPDISGYR